MDAWQLSWEVFLHEMLIKSYEDFLKVGVNLYKKKDFLLISSKLYSNIFLFIAIYTNIE